ncbi:hypothetical protein BIWAKO_00531 [Bosea sp. BIWAKO-01]|nr:hypothetical protein BIWAKO_00531 [Bosea sp. BIWAKO-01]
MPVLFHSGPSSFYDAAARRKDEHAEGTSHSFMARARRAGALASYIR